MFYLSARSYFAALQYEYRSSGEYQLNVFSKHELGSFPLKWLKYLLLAKIGLTTEIELNRTILRFDIDHLEDAKIKSLELCDIHKTDSFMIVVKIVYLDKAGQLPNFRIFSKKDVDDVFTEINKIYKNMPVQIWLCTSDVSSNSSNFGGRITYDLAEYASSILEVIWFTSPRRIEEYKYDNSFPYPFARLIKQPGHLAYVPIIIYSPSDDYKKGLLLQDVSTILLALDKYKEEIEMIKVILHGAGANEVSIEFKSSSGKFTIIDWDTEIETSLSS